ncbi:MULTISPECIES: polymer-forming cytoskeletal protein [Pseudoalteromonas]|uniref:Integral membrane protein n=1 Tax=Pseudoalteromonas translucida (strain TAC 125) TaxID=326442 RepID=Q3IET1_PSET1|nr:MULTISPECIES: polymer-forming cytoskeletal protein [Pseudoalteromonas]MBB1406869.1 polymer-forming cytoskeletal protein [Pseudoalteromonas sp. SG44-5]MBH0071412.1 polymer-forming cytoskeletal protein [Pseudoalteromonas sp. NZS127]MBO7925521.1 polymer-forming cytoskeletal protein [Pseudoalteromonas sp. K222D]CAI87227.1 putative Integral membrane protein [Pseudoalteromonas translucida]
MFGKKKQVTNNASLKRVNHAPSIISEDMRLTGSIISQGEVQLDGRIDGDIKATHLVIGTTGVVEGIVEATSVIVKGKIIGSLNASEVNIKNNAHVHGDIFHDTLSIEAGAIIEGNLKQRFEKENLTLINDESKPVSDVKPLINEDDIGLSFVNKQASNKS